MAVQSVELLLDSESEERVRSDWLALTDAGLPAVKPSSTPHVTLAAAHQIWPRIDRSLAGLTFSPFRLRIGPLGLFTGRNASAAVLVRLVTPSVELLELHSAVYRVLNGAEGLASHTKPGDWTPHVTLARRFPLNRVEDATGVLRGAHEFTATAVSIRRWDGVNRRSWPVSDTPDHGGE